jgi:hypothetical protein
MGTLTYIGAHSMASSLYASPVRSGHPRQIVIYADHKAMATSKPVGRYCLRGSTLEWRPAKTCN